MTHLIDTTLDLVRGSNYVTLDWLLQKTIGRTTHDPSLEVTRAINEIHTALVNAGWQHFRHTDQDGSAIHTYRQPLSDQPPAPPREQPASGNRAAARHRQTAPEILAQAAQCIGDRAASRDLPAERSMARTVRAYNAITGHALAEREGWLFMAVLKAARATAGSHNPDDYTDGAAYFALAGESAQTDQQPED